MVLIRCRYYDDDGQPVYGGCPSSQCNFTHPSQEQWRFAQRKGSIASGPPRGRGRGRGSGFNQGRGRSDRHNLGVGDRMASSTWGLPSSPPRPRDDPPSSSAPAVSWDTSDWTDDAPKSTSQPATSWPSTIESKGKEKSNDATITSDDTSGSTWGSNVGWGSASPQGGWGSSGGGWGSGSGDGGWGSGDGGGGWGSSSPKGWGTGADNASSSSSSQGLWGNSSRGENANAKKDEPIETPPTQMASTAPVASTSIPKAEKPNVPAIRIPSDQRIRDSSPHIASASASASPSVGLSKQRVPLPGRGPSKGQDKPSTATTKSAAAAKSRETTPLQKPGSSKERKMGYEMAVAKTCSVVDMRTELTRAKASLQHWKGIQSSPYFERVRPSGRDKLNKIRTDRTRIVKDLEKKIAEEELVLTHEVPSVSSFSAGQDVDVLQQCERVRSYIAEVDAYIADLERYREEQKQEKLKAAELELQRQRELEEASKAQAEMPPPPPPLSESPVKVKEKELWTRITRLQSDLEDLAGVVDENRDYKAAEQITDTAYSRFQEKAQPARDALQEERQRVTELKRMVEESTEALKVVEARRAERVETKKTLEEAIAQFQEWEKERAELIAQLFLQVRNFPTLRPKEPEPIPYYELLLPHVNTMTEDLLQKLVLPAFSKLDIECKEQAVRMHDEAVSKIDGKMQVITNLTNTIRDLARDEASRYS
ncbi:hypothetical protein VNI00_002066 [Paramarasmius palmivorus]|uniref:C3H1-type domain-containing protein n=1 Tax=Paramarasmius palmivorus TaxID=297713 RepID=A0AAW0E3Q8_9AGAR